MSLSLSSPFSLTSPFSLSSPLPSPSLSLSPLPSPKVFGPIIRALMDVGYDHSNLIACPYDWRLPPSKLEERDGFFSFLKGTIEMYSRVCLSRSFALSAPPPPLLPLSLSFCVTLIHPFNSHILFR